MIFLAIILVYVDAYSLYQEPRTYVVNPTFSKIARSWAFPQKINISISSEGIPFNMFMRIEKAESVLTPEFKYNYKNFERYLEIDERLYDGKVDVIDKVTNRLTTQSVVVEKFGEKINALFTNGDKQYMIEPMSKVSRSFMGTNPHILRIVYRTRNYTYNEMNDTNRNLTLEDSQWTYTNSNRLFEKRTDGQQYIIEATIHIPLFKISTPIRYYLHIIAQVNQIFKYPVLNVDLKIKIANILMYPDNFVYENYYMTLDQLFSYKGAYLEDMDLAILITNQLHKTISPKPVTGLAGFEYMCMPYLSAMVVQDEGFFTAHTIAHEVGHMLGAIHDMQTACNGTELRGIMHYDSDVTQINTWSQCSAKKIRRFLEKPYADCLRKQHDMSTLRGMVTLPGYDLFDQQCSLTISDPYSFIISKDSNCSFVWCRMTKGRKARLNCPPMEGTPCMYSEVYNKTILVPFKYGKICFRGTCSTTSQVAEKLNITYGPWQDWSACSVRGYKIRERICKVPERIMCEGPPRRAKKC